MKKLQARNRNDTVPEDAVSRSTEPNADARQVFHARRRKAERGEKREDKKHTPPKGFERTRSIGIGVAKVPERKA